MSGILWDSNDAAYATGGKNTCDWVAYGVSIDTRTLNQGDIFLAITDNRNGHDFVAEAFKKGASAAVVSYVPESLNTSKPLLIVEDVYLALKALAVFARNRCKGQFIAITGSVGKTSSKDMLAVILSNLGKVSKAEKSFNNHLGVPLTLARTAPDSDFAIIEIGMSGKEEIGPLSALVRPHIALITDVSEAHLASFKDVKEIAKEKSDICVGLSENSYCVVSRDTSSYSDLSAYIKKFGVRIISFGENKLSSYKLVKTVIKNNKTCSTAVLPTGSEFFFKVNTPGTHHAKNALGIICIVEVLGMDITKGIFGLSDWSPSTGRGLITNVKFYRQYSIQNFTIIDETYNANPNSVIAAINVLANFTPVNDDMNKNGRLRRIAILGDMLELGSETNTKHAELIDKLDLTAIDVIHCVGNRMNFFYDKLPNNKKGKWVETVKELSRSLSYLVRDQDIIMLKASNTVGLNSLIKELKSMGTIC